MIPTLTDIIQDFTLFVQWSSSSVLQIKWIFWTDIELFLSEIKKTEFFNEEKNLFVEAQNKKDFKKFLAQYQDKEFERIIISNNWFSLEEIEHILIIQNISGQIIFFSEDFLWVETNIFSFPEIGFRAFAKAKNNEIIIPELLQKKANFKELENIFSEYLDSGASVGNTLYPEHIIEGFNKKCAIMAQELFEKEKEIFIEFIRTLALEIGSLFKEDKIAKQLGISRRKVKKFMDLLQKYDIIREIFPFVNYEENELSRHTKIYFSNLAYYHGALSIAYKIGHTKKSVLENFVFLELSRKLDNTHELFFWRKKSGTEITFVLRNIQTNKLTPIEVETKSMDYFSASMKSFYDSYAENIENSMLLNDSKISQKTIWGKPFFALPHYAI